MFCSVVAMSFCGDLDLWVPGLGGDAEAGPRTDAGEVEQSLSGEGGGSTTSSKTSLPTGQLEGKLAHPTDRMLGGAEPNGRNL